VFGRALWAERPAATLHPVYRPDTSPASRRRLAQCHNVHENNSPEPQEVERTYVKSDALRVTWQIPFDLRRKCIIFKQFVVVVFFA